MPTARYGVDRATSGRHSEEYRYTAPEATEAQTYRGIFYRSVGVEGTEQVNKQAMSEVSETILWSGDELAIDGRVTRLSVGGDYRIVKRKLSGALWTYGLDNWE